MANTNSILEHPTSIMEKKNPFSTVFFHNVHIFRYISIFQVTWSIQQYDNGI